ncbi:hypothetical protein GC207_09360 [bacterium]|nr:hypothetical protein [bacterium]
MNPLIFNESFVEHAHCIVAAQSVLRIYADEHGGRFPESTNGFGDALLPLSEDAGYAFTGPMFDDSEFVTARHDGRTVDESKLGRIYMQGLSEHSNPAIALLFDRVATPGGDHCHLFNRLFAPYGREVLELGDGKLFVRDTDWYAYATNQVALLVAQGINRKTAQSYYEMTGLKFEE